MRYYQRERHIAAADAADVAAYGATLRHYAI